jgi:hypothetical protein
MWWLALSAALAAPLDSDQALLHVGPDMDPDGAWAGYGGQARRWTAHIGTHLSLFGGERGPVVASLGLQGFTEIANFTGSVPVSYESFRAHIGLDSLWSIPALDASLPTGGRLHARLGYFHESDHVSDYDTFERRWVEGEVIGAGTDFETIIYEDYDDDNVSSYEFVRLRVVWQQPWGDRWTTTLSAEPRRFTPDLNPYARRALRWGAAGEGRVAARLTESGSLALGMRFERWWHDFNPVAVGLRPGLGVAPSTWASAEVAWQWEVRADHTVVPYLAVSDGNGRSADFFVDHGLGWGGGLRFVR